MFDCTRGRMCYYEVIDYLASSRKGGWGVDLCVIVFVLGTRRCVYEMAVA